MLDPQMLYIVIKIACLVSWLIMTKIVLNPENNESFSIKSIEMEFHSHFEMESYLSNL